jgi:hypothetical protein
MKTTLQLTPKSAASGRKHLGLTLFLPQKDFGLMSRIWESELSPACR